LVVAFLPERRVGNLLFEFRYSSPGLSRVLGRVSMNALLKSFLHYRRIQRGGHSGKTDELHSKMA
jgi:hypothetical protein